MSTCLRLGPASGDISYVQLPWLLLAMFTDASWPLMDHVHVSVPLSACLLIRSATRLSHAWTGRVTKRISDRANRVRMERSNEQTPSLLDHC